MKRLSIGLASVSLAAAAAGLTGCASTMEPAMAAGTAMAYGIIYASTAVAITTGRTLTTVLGVEVRTIPYDAKPPYGAILPKPVP